ncbi:MAG: hypothetical protein P1S60_02755 [Anaerolineae bacterium]|nr:hypothetical protein [Anaerolineae bacterium]
MKTNRSWWLYAILVLSVGIRIAIALYFGDVVDAPSLLTDQRSYHALGARLVGGYGFSFATGWYPFTLPDTPTAHWSFLYSLFVAAVYAVFGVHPLAARLVQAVLGGVLLPWGVYRWTRVLFAADTRSNRENIALIAAGCAAVYGYFILYAVTIMTETFYIVALLWSLESALRMSRFMQEEKPVPWAVTLQFGLSLGLCALLRQSILPWVPVLFLWLLLNARPAKWFAVQTLKPLLITGLILIAFILPFTIRNYRVYSDFLLLNSNTGYAMYSAQHPMHGTRFQEFEAAPLPPDFVRGTEPQMDRALLARGIRFILNDPVRYILLSVSRVRAYIEFWPTPDTTLLHNIGRTGSFGLFLPFMLYGIVLLIKRQWAHLAFCESSGARPGTRFIAQLQQPVTLLLLFALFYSLLHILTWAMVRYRLPVDAVVLPCAALAIQTLVAQVLPVKSAVG